MENKKDVNEKKVNDELKKGVSITNDKKSFIMVDDAPIKKGTK